MRVVSGTAKGRRLAAPAGRATRPTSDRVREAVFSMLVSLDAIEGATVVDLFAGSGALGIEALSRGAAHVTFVETDREALEVIRANLQTTGLADRATVTRGDAAAFAGSVDVAFVDPPYTFDAWESLLSGLRAGLAVLESDHEVDVGAEWTVGRTRRHGGTVVTLARRSSHQGDQ
jgi:16S rRNA (guanine966-N2)-methyltransferase